MKYPLGIFFSEEVSPGNAPAPRLGQANQDIYRDELGLTEQDLVRLRANGDI